MTIFEKILKIMSTVQYLAKDDRVEFGSTNYRALSEEKVTSIMRRQLIDNGLIVYPMHQTTTRTGNITHVDVVYRMINVDDPLDYIDIASCGDGADTQDKGSGKAMTYAFKYMWLRTFALPTGEDPDKISSAELDDIQRRQQETEPVPCADCSNVIVSVPKKDGSPWAVDDMVKYSTGRFGRPLCAACMKKAKKAEENKAAVANYGS